MTTVNELNNFAKAIQESVNCCLPARVVQVNKDGSVNVVAIRNDKIDDCVITIPVIRPETQRAYIYLGLKQGDRGVVKFLDKSIEDYRITGSEAYNGDDRVHSISDGVFQLGFLPDNEKFVFPEGELVIGLKNNTFTLNVNENGGLTISAKSFTINSDVTINGTLTATTDVVGGGISLKNHTHSGVTAGSGNTGKPK